MAEVRERAWVAHRFPSQRLPYERQSLPQALYYSIYHLKPPRSMGSWYHSLTIVVTRGNA